MNHTGFLSDPVNVKVNTSPFRVRCYLETDQPKGWNRGVDLDGVGDIRLVFALSIARNVLEIDAEGGVTFRLGSDRVDRFP